MSFSSIREKAKWWCLFAGSVFLSASSYLKAVYVFTFTTLPSLLLLIALLAATLTLVFGVLAFPRWQSYVAITICGYAIYWMTLPPYAIGCH